MQTTNRSMLHAVNLLGSAAGNQSTVLCMRRAWLGRVQASKRALTGFVGVALVICSRLG
jgi:hypothetical protein